MSAKVYRRDLSLLIPTSEIVVVAVRVLESKGDLL